MSIDINANRRATKWPWTIQLARVAWAMCRPFFRLSPRIFWRYRAFMLRCFGASVGRNVHVSPTALIAMPWHLKIDRDAAIGDRVILYSLAPISIGAATTVSQGAHLCAGTHDYRRADMPLIKRPITIGDGAWICADAFIGPGVEVGEHAIVGARAVVMRDVDRWTIVVGNPARSVKSRPPLKVETKIDSHIVSG